MKKNQKLFINSKKMKVLVLVLMISLVSIGMYADEVEAKDTFTNSINSCPGGWILGTYSLNYEKLFGRHGMVVRFDYEMIDEKYSGNKYDATGYNYIINYRLHTKESLNSYFLGSYLRYKQIDGKCEYEANKFDFTIDEFTIGLNAGRRWVWNNGFNIVFQMGYGYACDDYEVSDEIDAHDKKVELFQDEYDFAGALFGELSIGYAF